MKKTLAVAVLLFASSLFAQERVTVVPDAGQLSAFAANGRLVGVFSPAPSPSGYEGSMTGLVRMEVLGEGVIFLPLRRGPDGLTWGGPDVWFTSSDCSGTAYGQPVSTVAERAAWVGINGTLYLWTPEDYSGVTGVGSQTLHSVASFDPEKGTRVCRQESTSGAPWIPLREVAKLDESFPPPFSLDPAGRSVRSVRH